MATRPFIAIVQIVLSSGGQGTGDYDAGHAQEFTNNRIQQSSTGTFDILDINLSSGNRLTNASLAQPINGQIFSDVEVDNNNPADLITPWLVDGNNSIQFTVKDTSSGANTVKLYLQGTLKI